MSQSHAILLGVLIGGLFLGWMIARWIEVRFDRESCGSSEDIFDEMEMIQSPRQGIEIRTRCKHVPSLFRRLSQPIEWGFSERQVRLLSRRILRRNKQGCQSVRFFIRLNHCRSELEVQWSRDGSDRVRLLIFAPPSIVRALKRQERLMSTVGVGERSMV